MNPEVRKWIESRVLAKEDEKFLKSMAFMEVQRTSKPKPAMPADWKDPQAFSKVCTVCDMTGLSQDDVIGEVMMEASMIASSSTEESLEEIFATAFRNTARELIGHHQDIPDELLDS